MSGCRRAGARSVPKGAGSSTRRARPVVQRLPRPCAPLAAVSGGNAEGRQRDWLWPAHVRGPGVAWMCPRVVSVAEVDRRYSCQWIARQRKQVSVPMASPKQETASGEPVLDPGVAMAKSRHWVQSTVRLPKGRAAWSIDGRHLGSQGRTFLSRERADGGLGRFRANGCSRTLRAESMTEVSEAGQLRSGIREDNALMSNGRGRRSVGCVVNRTEPHNPRGNSERLRSRASCGCSRTTCRWHSSVARIFGPRALLRSKGRCRFPWT